MKKIFIVFLLFISGCFPRILYKERLDCEKNCPIWCAKTDTGIWFCPEVGDDILPRSPQDMPR